MSIGGRWIVSRITGELVTPEEFQRELGESRRSSHAAPMIISDCMEPTLNHADGKRYSSKSSYQKAVKAAGCEIVGNDPSFKQPAKKEYKAEGLKQDIKRAIDAHA